MTASAKALLGGIRYLQKESFSQSARLASGLLLPQPLVKAIEISIRSREVATENEKGRMDSLRRAIEVVKNGGAIGVMGFAATRRPTASKERRRSIVVVLELDKYYNG